jgi:tetratricopeptide (TPR) repeat protein
MSAENHAQHRRELGPALAIAGLTFLVFSRALTFGFVNFDDNVYITQNTVMQEGLSPRTAAWAWTAAVSAQWYPLTLLSHLLDVSLFGLNPAGHHATSVLIHSVNAGLLYLALGRLTGQRGAAMAVSLLFALHPLRVESVAWISERKDVLSGFFWMLALLAYARYARRPSAGRYAPLFIAAAAGLLCKPMAVTLPFVLLLLDGWPLGRFSGPERRRRAAFLLAEKIPLFGLSLAATVVTLSTQSVGGAVAGLGAVPFQVRILNAIGAYWVYVAQTLVPIRLAVFYPMPELAGLYLNAGAGFALLTGVSVVAYGLRRRVPAVGVGWLWFVGTLAPVIGIVQVGAQAHADRYTYLPQVGLLMALVWSVRELPALEGRRIGVGAAAVACAALAGLTWVQLGYWRSSETLFGHALRVTTRNARAHDYYGQALLAAGDPAGAMPHFEASIRLEAGNPQPRHNLAAALAESGNEEAAVALAKETLALFPEHVGSLFFLGSAALGKGRVEEAAGYLERAVALAPARADARVNLGICYARLGRAREAEAEFLAAVRADPQYAPGYSNLGVLALEGGDREAARVFFTRALSARPDYAPARAALEAMDRSGR